MIKIETYVEVTHKESKLIKLIAKTGLYIEGYSNDLSISRKILRSCKDKDLICEGEYMFFYRKLCKPYFLTKTGISIIKDKLDISPYRSRITQGDHDFVLAKIYLSLSEEEQDSWITETALEMKYPGMTVSDGIYKSSKGPLVGVEVLTNSYTKDEIKRKTNFIKKHCDASIIINADKIYNYGKSL
jgi:hypothetical protein